jgi:hypothetical protein
MATRKLRDVTALIDDAQTMQRVLEALLKCQCVELADCVQLARPGTSVQADSRGVRRRAARRRFGD